MLKQLKERLGLDSSKKTSRTKLNNLYGYSRNLRIEPLEDRRMLATYTVNVLHDNTGPGGLPLVADGHLTLRDAIAYVNFTANPDGAELGQVDLTEPRGTNDTIVFSTDPSANPGNVNLNGQTIELNDNSGRRGLEITESVTIDASMLTSGLTGDANGDAILRAFSRDGSLLFLAV